MKGTIIVLLAAGLIAAFPSFAVAKSAKSKAPGQRAEGARGASYQAPAQVKKRAPVKNIQKKISDTSSPIIQNMK